MSIRDRACVVGGHEALSDDESRFYLSWDGDVWHTRPYKYGPLCETHAQARAELLNGPGIPVPPARTRLVPERGVELDGVFVPLEVLGELAEQDVWDSQFGRDAFLIRDRTIAHVLEANGLAIKETKGGYHRGPKLQQLLRDLAQEDNE